MGTCSQSPSRILLFRFSNIQYTMQCVSVLLVQITRAGYLAVLCFHFLPTVSPFLPPGGWVGGSARVLLGHGFVSYPLREMLTSHRCRCSLAVVLYLLVSHLGIVVFVVFSKLYMVWGGDFHRPTNATILSPSHPFLLVFVWTLKGRRQKSCKTELQAPPFQINFANPL